MAQAAFLQEPREARLVTGRVVGGGNGIFRVLEGNVPHEALLAASCLLEPREQDAVLLACLENGADVILSVLFRDETATARLRLPKNSAVECPGELTVRSAVSLGLQSGKALRLESEELSVSAVSASATAARVNTAFDTAEFCCRALTALGQTAVSAFRSVTQCLGESRRMVEGSDETRCANSVLIAGETATALSRNSLALAEETARTDAKLIQLG
jgi:hypothetical protein